jgi:transposase
MSQADAVLRDAINPLNPELNPICYLLAILGAHHFLRVSRIRVKSLTLRLLMSHTHTHTYIYIWSTHS